MTAAFDSVAAQYDATWTHSPVGRLQRQAIWTQLKTLVRPGDRVLDLGCGTGEDAVWLESHGARVTAIDSSARMVSLARNRGVDARHLSLERLGELNGR